MAAITSISPAAEMWSATGTFLANEHSNFLLRQAFATMRSQQDFSRSFCSCCCPPLLSCSFLVPLGLLSHYLSTSLVVFLCFLFPPLVRIALRTSGGNKSE